MFGKRHTTICREGWYCLGILAFIIGGAMVNSINLLYVVAGMMIGPLLFNTWCVVRSLRRLDVTRRLPSVIGAGEVLVVDVVAANRRRFGGAWAVVVEDRIRREGGTRRENRKKVETLLPNVPPNGRAVSAYRGRLTRRGRYRFGPLRASTRFPLGLVRRTITFDQVDTLVVYPRLGRLTPQWLKVVRAAQMGIRGSRRRHGTLEGDYYGLRDWRSGDSRRWIHWRTSARRGALAVRLFEQQRNQDLALLLDLWQGPSPTDDQLEAVELAVSFAATAVAGVCRRGGSRLLVATAGREKVHIVRGAASMVLFQEAMEHFAVVEAAGRDRLVELLDGSLDNIPPGAATVLVTTRPVDLDDTERLKTVLDDRRKREMIGRMISVDASSSALAEYYHVD